VSNVSHVLLEELMATRLGTVNPSKHRDEVFELYSIPSYDSRSPEVVQGSEIGSAKQAVQSRDVLLSLIVPHIRRSWIVGNEDKHRLIASGEWIVFRSTKAHPEYLRHVLLGDWFHAQFMQTVSGVGGSLLRARPAQVAKISIPLPSIPEQRRIAAILDKADTLRAKRREALAQLDSLAQSIFVEMFGAPSISPKRWETRSVGDVTDCIVPGRDKPKSFTGNIPWVTTEDLEHLGFTQGKPKGLGLTNDEIAEVRARVIPSQSILMSCVGNLGVTSIAERDMVINQQLHSFQCHGSVNNIYLMYALAAQSAYMYSKASSTTLPYMNKSVCNSIPVQIPPLELQTKFAQRYSAISRMKARHRFALEYIESLFNVLQHRAFNGEL
jgi:type I restriction enzyme S subunit